ncbi:uncharacterized protein PAC_12885 [Phialocephala subalpina]|uniref:Zn(2)-C6 fungal-type domain-containing protein n=1 Tax=Phialocephala subalpina TaxID=576137 RepID=A0A1L7XD98_9HELO|nr:uncharacterized protein PAC_12885 [Phialocephala subalpina]
MSPQTSRPQSRLEDRSVPLPMRGMRSSEQAMHSKADPTASGDAASRPKSGRMGKPKTRTGCITCKIRRIKCDEGKPACKRCIITGRQCDGYRQPSQLKGTASRPQQNAKLRPATAAVQLHLVIKFNHRLPPQFSDYTDVTMCERRSLEYFRCRTADVLSRWVVESFWKYQLPQTAHSEPATRHAMIALAGMHEGVELLREASPNDPRISSDMTASRLQYARHHYNIAVSELARALRERNDSEEVALMSCALFVIFNFIAGNFIAAFFHMHNGIEILSRWKTSKVGSRILAEDSLEKNLITLFGRISFHSSSLDDPAPILEFDDPLASSFPTLQNAKIAMDSLTRGGIRLVRIGAVLAYNPQAAESWDDLDFQASAHLLDLTRWLSKFDTLVASLPVPYTTEDEGTIDILRIMHLAAHTWIWVGLSPLGAPEPTSMLERFVDLAESTYEKWRFVTIRCPINVHVFDTGLVPPLNFIARKSQSQRLRFRAKECLMKIAPQIVMDSSKCSIAVAPPLEDEVVPVPMLGNMNLDVGMADIGENGLVEVEVEPGTDQIGISLKPKRSGDGWEVRKDFAI